MNQTETLHFLVRHGYALLFFWVFVEQAGLPIPSAPLLLAAGALAGSSLAVERSPSPARPEVAPPRRFRVRLPETHPEEMVFRVIPSVLPRYLFWPVSLSLVISYRSTPPSPSGRFE